MENPKAILHANRIIVQFLDERAQLEPAIRSEQVYDVASELLYCGVRLAQEGKEKHAVGVSEATAYLDLDVLLAKTADKSLPLKVRLCVKQYLKSLPGVTDRSIKRQVLEHPEAEFTHRARLLTIFGAQH